MNSTGRFSCHDALKILLLGDNCVGKTFLAMRARDPYHEFVEFPKTTIGIDWSYCTLELPGRNVHLNVFDTPGTEYFHWISKSYLRMPDIKAVIVVYDVTSAGSFDVAEYWLKTAKELGDPDTLRYLVGNKCDVQDGRQVSREQGDALARIYGVKRFIETSTLQLEYSHHLEDFFRCVVIDILNVLIKRFGEDRVTAQFIDSPSNFKFNHN